MADRSYEDELRDRRIRQERLDTIVKAAMSRVVAQIAGREPRLRRHFFYGASAIHPRHLVTWYLFNTDAEWEDAKKGGLISNIDRLTREELASGGYPAEGIPLIHVSFVSDETIQREAGGDYRAYFA